MSNFIRLIKKIEQPGGWFGFKLTSMERVAAYLRELAYNNGMWALTCGTTLTGTVWRTGLTDKEIALLKAMIGHNSDSSTGLEKGLLLTRDGTVALGHVITGIDCGGFNRDTHVTTAAIVGLTSNIDNLFQSTISGDIGQTTLLHYAYPNRFPLLGPSGDWDSASCPKVYTLNPRASSELTDAEILGDIDGAILGTIIPMIKKTKLSEIFHDYYQGSGLHAGARVFKATTRATTFGELIADHELEAQSKAFASAYYNSKDWNPFGEIYNGTSKEYLMNKVPSTVHTFYKNLFKSCPVVLKTKYTISYFIKLVKQLEKETKFGIAAMTRAIVKASKYPLPRHVTSILSKYNDIRYKYTSGFAWYVIREMLLHRFVDRDGKRELGVIDAGEDTVAIGPVLAGLTVGANYKTKSSGDMTEVALMALHAVTVTGRLASAANSRARMWMKPKEIMGMTGVWDRSSCPPKYRYTKRIMMDKQTTRAELLGGIDGAVLGERVHKWLAANRHLKLSAVLKRYYGAGYKSVSSQKRLVQFKDIFAKKDVFLQRVSAACSSSYCRQTAKEVVNTFYNTMLPSSGKHNTEIGLVRNVSKICMCERVSVRLSTCMRACVYACLHACMHACIYVYMFVCMYVCMYVCIYVCMYVCMYMDVCMYVCMHVCMYVCMCVCVYVCIHYLFPL